MKFFLFMKICKSLPMSVQSQGGFLFMKEKQVNHIQIQCQSSLLKTAPGCFSIVGIAFACDDRGRGNGAQGCANVRISLI